MINIKRKEDCCGCQVCGDICPKESITFETDNEGIWYPVVNQDTCVDCHLCEKVCPIQNKISRPDNCSDPVTYVLQAPNTIDRLKSASGGAYTLLLQEVFRRGGFVAGHIWDDKASVKGYISCNPEDLDILRGTKYLQSDVKGIYKAVKVLLNEGHFVLFSGCPCQIAAMRSYLKRDYDNLIMTDFVCMGIDSPWAFQRYIESLENQYHAKMIFFKAKSKEVGWRYLTNKARFENGRSYFGINGVDTNLKATFLNVLVRPSCYECKYKGFPRNSDITIGDYWRKTITKDPLDDNTGTSYAMLHNDKAQRFFENIKEKCHCRQVSVTDILGANRHAIKSLSRPYFSREEFYCRLQEEDFSSLVNDYYYKSKKKLSILSIIRKYIKVLVGGAYYNRKSLISYLRFLHYNLFSSKVKANILCGDILIIRNAKLKCGHNSKIVVKGQCIIDGIGGQTGITLRDNAQLFLDNNLVECGTKIELLPDSKASFGFRTILGKNANINVTSDLNVGEFCLFDNNVIIDDLDSGIVFFDGTDNYNKQITIGTHALLGRGCIVCGNTAVGDESVIREYSVVKGIVPAHSLVSGVPAKVIDNDINWKHNFDFIWNYKN